MPDDCLKHMKFEVALNVEQFLALWFSFISNFYIYIYIYIFPVLTLGTFCRIKSYTLIILACIKLILCCWKPFLILWERKIFTCVNYIAVIQKAIQKFIANSPQKLLSEHSFQAIFSNCYQRNHSKIRETIPNFFYKLQSDKSLQVILTNCYQRNHLKHYLVTIISE